ncbi:MAG: OmpP1/FadL family transporter [Thiohalospira sp.]
MKKITLLIIGILLVPLFSYSGGIVTNQNQSAAYIRMFARDASTDIDAVFFNPAGLTKLGDGFYFSLNNQYILQNKYVTSNYPYLTGSPVEYQGEVNVPLFPGIYGAYKKGKFALSLGINPVGGGGSATFDNGLPSFEIPVSNLVPSLQAQLEPVDQYIESLSGSNPGFRNISGYSADIAFEGSSVYWGFQLNASYEINEIFSFAVGGRYISAKNVYTGSFQNVTIDAPENYGGTQAPGDYLRTVESITGITSLGDAADQVDAQTADFEVDVTQSGSGFAPILGVNISPNDQLNIAVKYEFVAKIELENDTKVDGSGMFPDGEKVRNDMPAMFSAGFDYKITDKLTVASGFHTYFDKNANYGKKLDGVYVDNDEVIDRNSTEFALGLEYDVSEKLLLSIGYLHTQTGVTEDYQTDLSFSNHSNSIGLGGAYAIKPGIMLNLGVGYTIYNDARKIYDYDATETLGQTIPTREEYDKDNLFVALGLDFKFGKKSEN